MPKAPAVPASGSRKTALVTGGAHRLGRAFSLALARAGHDVVVNFHSSGDQADRTVADIEAIGRRAIAIRADVAQEAQVARLVASCEATFGRLDVVVNSASLFESAPLESILGSDWDRVLDINLKGPFMVARDAAPMLRATQGLIVNIADLSAFQPWPSHAHHSVSKAGLVHLTRILARALAPDVRVNCIAPGTVLPPGEYVDATGATAGRKDGAGDDAASSAAGDDAGERAAATERTVLGRRGSVEDVTRALLYYVQSDFVTGDVAVIDGGRLLL